MAVGLILLLAALQDVEVEGTRTRFAAEMEEEGTRWMLTGAGVRTKTVLAVTVKVYAVGSYVRRGPGFQSPQALAEADVPKQLVLVMERDVDGKSISQAFEDGVAANHPKDAFPRELAAFQEHFAGRSVAQGDRVRIEHLPGRGVEIRLPGRNPLIIENVAYSRALWEIYFGGNCISEDLKAKLFSRKVDARETPPERPSPPIGVWAAGAAVLVALGGLGLWRRARTRRVQP